MRLDHLLYRESQKALDSSTVFTLIRSLNLIALSQFGKKRSVQFRRTSLDEMATGTELRVVIAFIDSLKFSRTDIIREISVYVIGCL